MLKGLRIFLSPKLYVNTSLFLVQFHIYAYLIAVQEQINLIFNSKPHKWQHTTLKNSRRGFTNFFRAHFFIKAFRIRVTINSEALYS